MRDYQRIEALDTYGREGIDDRDYGQMGVEERAAAEAELALREVRCVLLLVRGGDLLTLIYVHV